jgi:hypothetical protein
MVFGDTMKVMLKPVVGTAKDNRERAKDEIIRVLGFRGDVVKVNIDSPKIIIEFEISPKWEAHPQYKKAYLKQCIPAKVKSVFEVKV